MHTYHHTLIYKNMKRTKLVCVVYVKLTDKYSLSLARSLSISLQTNRNHFLRVTHCTTHEKYYIHKLYSKSRTRMSKRKRKRDKNSKREKSAVNKLPQNRNRRKFSIVIKYVNGMYIYAVYWTTCHSFWAVCVCMVWCIVHGMYRRFCGKIIALYKCANNL